MTCGRMVVSWTRLVLGCLGILLCGGLAKAQPPASSSATEESSEVLSFPWRDRIRAWNPFYFDANDDGWLAQASRDSDWSFLAEAIYWASTDPAEQGQLITQTRFPDGGGNPTIVTFKTGDVNTDHEFGLRLTLARRLTDLYATEIRGFWIHPYQYPRVFVPNPAQAQDRVILTPTNERLSYAQLLYQTETSGLETNLRALAWRAKRYEFDILAGLRYLQHDEFFGLIATPNTGNNQSDEHFKTFNDLLGPQVGLTSRFRLCEFLTLQGGLKAMFGVNFANVSIRGPLNPGRLVGPNNIGWHESAEFAVLLDLNVGLVFHVTPNFHVHANYDGMWFNRVVRAMDQLDIPGASAFDPVINRREREMWLAGGSIGLEYTY